MTWQIACWLPEQLSKTEVRALDSINLYTSMWSYQCYHINVIWPGAICRIWSYHTLVDSPSSCPKLRSGHWIPSIYIHQCDHINVIISIWYDQVLYVGYDHTTLLLTVETVILEYINMIISIWSYQYDHTNMIISIWSYWYDQINMIISIW